MKNYLPLEKNFEPVGMPYLFILIITGILMVYDFDVTIDKWFFKNSIEKIVNYQIGFAFG